MVFRRKPSQPDVPRRRIQRDDDDMPIERTSGAVFQRNRTLTGSTSERMSSTHHPTDLQSPRTHAHHLTIKRRKVGSLLLIILAAIAVLLWILTQFTAKVIITSSDTQIVRQVSPERYEKAIQDYLGANPLARLRFAMDVPGLEAYLAQTLPEVDHVERVQMGNLGETDFVLSMRRPVAGWNINSKQYYVDAKGIAFEQNYYAVPGVQIIDNSGAQAEQGTAVASNRFLSFVGRVVAQAKARSLTVTQATLPKDTTRELDVTVAEMPSYIKLSIDRPAGEQVEDMARAVTYLKSQGRTPEYIDVRVSGKAFYK